MVSFKSCGGFTFSPSAIFVPPLSHSDFQFAF